MSFPPPILEYCTRHPDVATGRHCTRCDRPACSQCLTQADIGSLCAECLRRAKPATRERIRFWNAAQSVLVTRVIIGLNAVIFVWVLFGSDRYIGGGVINGRELDMALSQFFIDDGEWYRLISSGFLHFGLFHVGMNMFLLWQLGVLLEPALGRARFALLYFVSMLGGAVGALVLSPNALTGGASGAVFGLMAAASVGLQQRGVNPLKTGIGATLILNLLITFTIPGISIGGHLGGALMGAAAGYAML
ncbi:MAG: rhomboid family intramembrane serine protease, partial [Ilumatobacteraceae bacterium]